MQLSSFTIVNTSHMITLTLISQPFSPSLSEFSDLKYLQSMTTHHDSTRVTQPYVHIFMSKRTRFRKSYPLKSHLDGNAAKCIYMTLSSRGKLTALISSIQISKNYVSSTTKPENPKPWEILKAQPKPSAFQHENKHYLKISEGDSNVSSSFTNFF